MPKSVSSTPPSGVTRMLPGLTSRWTKPAWWAASSAAATHVPMWIVSSGLSRVCTSSSWRRLLPSTSCITTAWRPVLLEHVVTATMLGWVRPATAIASRRKRSATTGSVARLGFSHLRATWRSSETGRWPATPRPSRPGRAGAPGGSGRRARSAVAAGGPVGRRAGRHVGGSTPAFRRRSREEVPVVLRIVAGDHGWRGSAPGPSGRRRRSCPAGVGADHRPIWPTTISPSVNGRSWSTNSSTSLQSACSTARCSMRPGTAPPCRRGRPAPWTRVRCLPYCSTTPFATSMIGLIASAVASSALALPMRPPFFEVLERVERAEHPGAGDESSRATASTARELAAGRGGLGHARAIVRARARPCGCRRPTRRCRRWRPSGRRARRSGSSPTAPER